MKTIFYTLTVVVVIIFAQPGSASAQLRYDDIRFGQATQLVVNSQKAILMDQVTGEVVAHKGGRDTVIPASLAKLFTALVVLDQKLPSNKTCELAPQDNVLGGKNLVVAKTVKVPWKNLLGAMLVDSSNNLARALARCTGLDDYGFAVQMNSKAIAQGALNTEMVEATGINSENTSTPDNLALVARAAFSTQEVRALSGRKTFSWCYSGPCKMLSHTSVLPGQSGILAAKTGYLDESGNHLLVSAKKGSRYYIVGVFGASTREAAVADFRAILSVAP